MGDFFNGWPEDGEPEGSGTEYENWEEEYQKRAEEYYDNKVARAERLGCLAVLTVSAWFGLWVIYIVLKGIWQLLQ